MDGDALNVGEGPAHSCGSQRKGAGCGDDGHSFNAETLDQFRTSAVMHRIARSQHYHASTSMLANSVYTMIKIFAPTNLLRLAILYFRQEARATDQHLGIVNSPESFWA